MPRRSADSSETDVSGQRKISTAVGQNLVELQGHIDRLSELLRPHCDDATLDMIDAGAEMISRAARGAVEPVERDDEGAEEKALQAA